MLVAVAATAQTPTATLSHDGNVKCFYGKEALVNAVAESANGDYITLSSGLFTATTIEKSITVKGAGMSADTINHIEPTVISGDVTISAVDVTVEGAYLSSALTLNHYNNIKIISCTVAGSIANKNTSNKGMVNKYFIGSKSLRYSSNNYSTNSFNVGCDSINFYITNSYVKNLYNGNKNANHIEATNSLIGFHYVYQIYNSSFTNCILWSLTGTYNYFTYSNYAYYCVGINAPNMFNDIVAAYGTEVGITNTNVTNFSDIFKTFTGSNQSEFEDYALTPTAASTYLGDDGTQVGIYGGSMPFNPKPNNPYITKCKVAEKSTPTGTLSVDIEVRPAQ